MVNKTAIEVEVRRKDGVRDDERILDTSLLEERRAVVD
jgi:hypothetical protein